MNRDQNRDIFYNIRISLSLSLSLSLSGVMLHYATPALSHLYFVDPQWLCDMLAHVVTVPEVNSFIPRKDGLSSFHIHTYSCATGWL